MKTSRHNTIEQPTAADSLAGRSAAVGFVLSDQNTNNFRYCIERNPRLRKLEKAYKLYRRLTKIFTRRRKGGYMFLLLRVCTKARGSAIPNAIQTYIDNYFFPDFHAFITYWQHVYDKRKPCFAEDPKRKEIIAQYNRTIAGKSERHFIANIDKYFSGIARRSMKTNEIISTMDVYRRYHPRGRMK